MTNIAAASAQGGGSGGTANNNDLVAALITAPTALDRLNLLPNDQDFVFDFNSPPAGATTPGKGKSNQYLLDSSSLLVAKTYLHSRLNRA